MKETELNCNDFSLASRQTIVSVRQSKAALANQPCVFAYCQGGLARVQACCCYAGFVCVFDRYNPPEHIYRHSRTTCFRDPVNTKPKLLFNLFNIDSLPHN